MSQTTNTTTTASTEATTKKDSTISMCGKVAKELARREDKGTVYPKFQLDLDGTSHEFTVRHWKNSAGTICYLQFPFGGQFFKLIDDEGWKAIGDGKQKGNLLDEATRKEILSLFETPESIAIKAKEEEESKRKEAESKLSLAVSMLRDNGLSDEQIEQFFSIKPFQEQPVPQDEPVVEGEQLPKEQTATEGEQN